MSDPRYVLDVTLVDSAVLGTVTLIPVEGQLGKGYSPVAVLHHGGMAILVNGRLNPAGNLYNQYSCQMGFWSDQRGFMPFHQLPYKVDRAGFTDPTFELAVDTSEVEALVDSATVMTLWTSAVEVLRALAKATASALFEAQIERDRRGASAQGKRAPRDGGGGFHGTFDPRRQPEGNRASAPKLGDVLTPIVAKAKKVEVVVEPSAQ